MTKSDCVSQYIPLYYSFKPQSVRTQVSRQSAILANFGEEQAQPQPFFRSITKHAENGFRLSLTEVKMSQSQPNSFEIFVQFLENIPDPRWAEIQHAITTNEPGCLKSHLKEPFTKNALPTLDPSPNDSDSKGKLVIGLGPCCRVEDGNLKRLHLHCLWRKTVGKISRYTA